MEWTPPSRPNGNLTKYIVNCTLIEDDAKGQNYSGNIYKETTASVQTVILSELRHSSLYKISVRACREPEPNNEHLNCSTEAIAYQRTEPIGLCLFNSTS